MDELKLLNVKSNLLEFLVKSSSNEETRKKLFQVYTLIIDLADENTNLQVLLSEEEIKNSILSAKIQELNRKITNLEREL